MGSRHLGLEGSLKERVSSGRQTDYMPGSLSRLQLGTMNNYFVFSKECKNLSIGSKLEKKGVGSYSECFGNSPRVG